MNEIKLANIAIIYGTDTGNTKYAAEKINDALSAYDCTVEMIDVKETFPEELETFDFLIMGIPTWDIGQVQDDWDDFEDQLLATNLAGKIVALYGLGDQRGYGEYYLDAMGWLHERVIKTQAIVIGECLIDDSYEFEESLGLNEEKTHFLGLALDEDNQFQLTEERIKKWVFQIVNEYSLQNVA